MKLGFKYNEYRWVPLSRVNISDVAKALNHPELRQWMAAEHSATFFEALTKRLASELEGKSLLFVIYKDKKILGLAGLSDYPGLFGTLQTSTYLHPDWWGKGLNKVCKDLLWGLSHELLGHDSIVASINNENIRSQKALSKQYPEASQGEVYEFWRPRQAFLFEIIGKEAILSSVEKRSIRRVLRRTPAWQRWLKRPAGEKVHVAFDSEASELHVESLYLAVSRVLAEQATPVRKLAEQVSHSNDQKAEAVLQIAGEMVADAQHQVAEEILHLASESEQIVGASQHLVTEAVVEIREEETGERVSEKEMDQILHIVEDGEHGTLPEIAEEKE